jgi:hypothetical protein
VSLESQIPAGNGTGAILRALGSLMAALGGDAPARPSQIEYAAEPERSQAPPARPQSPRMEAPRVEAPRTEVSRSASPIPGASSDVEMLLSDARVRAERILQDSMDRAAELLSRERSSPPSVSGAEIETLRRSLEDLQIGMRDVHSRLGRIESILGTPRAGTPAPPPPASMTPPPAPRPAFAPPMEEERRPGGLSVVTPYPASAAPPPPPPPAVEAPAAQGMMAPPPAPVRPAPPPPLPPSAVPPMRSAAQPAAAHMVRRPEPISEPEPVEAPAAESWERDHEDDVPGTLATFTAADGSVQLRAAPVSGFQGLMRLQDALQRLPAVRAATVEAYSQGEARLRLEIGGDIDSDEIAEGLAAGLGQNAVVQEASEADRAITIAFG